MTARILIIAAIVLAVFVIAGIVAIANLIATGHADGGDDR